VKKFEETAREIHDMVDKLHKKWSKYTSKPQLRVRLLVLSGRRLRPKALLRKNWSQNPRKLSDILPIRQH
jgi:uncharacterized protein YifE (UPF0438 family)